MNFPTMIEWIEEKGFTYLHLQHEADKKERDEKILFDSFVKSLYLREQEAFYLNLVHVRREPNISFNEGEPDVEGAKIIMKSIIHKGLRDEMIRSTIDKKGLAPDYHCATTICNTFWEKVLPAVEQALSTL